MSPREFQIEFERRLLMVDPTYSDNKISSDAIFSLLNEAVDEFYKTRYSGINVKGVGFELNQKRVDDLRTLIKTKKYTLTSNTNKISSSNSIYSITLPEDYTILLGDTVGIAPIDDNNLCWSKDDKGNYIIKYVDTLESSTETIDRQLNNSLSEHKLHYCTARPLKLIENDLIKLYTDGNYKVSEYTIKYLTKPGKLSLGNKPTELYKDLPEHTHMEIVKLAILCYLGMKGVASYNSYSNEVNKME